MSNRTRFRLEPLIAALALFAPAAATAQTIPPAIPLGGTASSKLQVSGDAPSACIISAPTANGVVNATVTAGPSSAQIRLTQLVDPVTSVPMPASVQIEFPVVCNGAHTLTISTVQGGLVLQTSAPPPGPGFRNHLSYLLSADWAGQQVQESSDGGTPVTINSSNAGAGQLNVRVQIPGGGDPLEAGLYSDSLVVNLRPTS